VLIQQHRSVITRMILKHQFITHKIKMSNSQFQIANLSTLLEKVQKKKITGRLLSTIQKVIKLEKKTFSLKYLF
jgi:hypothetical protein